MRKTLALMAMLAAAVFVVPASQAITDGELDGTGHPFVGLMVADVAPGAPAWRCSGTLLSPTVYLTAGHCTDGAVDARVWFDTDVTYDNIPFPLYPFGGPGSGSVEGTPITYPGYNPNAFFLADVGVVILDTPVIQATYGTLPAVDSLDVYATKRGQSKASFTSVGYGLQMSFPDAASWKENNLRLRYVAHPKLNQINGGIVGDFSLLLSNNANTGGTCFGDSGGPNFLGDTTTVAGVTSFGLNGNCAGTGGVFRMDRAAVNAWVSSFLP